MSINLINLIQDQKLKEIAGNLVTSTVVALKQLNKIVTGKTAQSVRSEIKREKGSAEIDIFAGGGMRYIIDGKPANTKLPVKKVGDEFELVQELKDWKNVVGFGGSDFVLARAIAKEKRDPVDVAGKTLEVFDQLYRKQTAQSLITLTAAELGKELKKMI